jgi:predicted lysophospholipase L1 biosynthesis ABC-type transport system permease subunit
VIINQTMARRYFQRESAVGHRIGFGGENLYTIIGVVKDLRERGYELAMKPAVYLATAQRPGESSDSLVVRVAGDPMRLAAAIRAVVAGIDPNQSVAAVRTLDEIVALNVADRDQQMTLLVVFAGLALFLAAVGLYAVLSYLVVQRRREIGLRVALGATRGAVMRMIATRGLLLTGVGAAVGLALAWAVNRTMQSLLYGVTPGDPVTIGAATALLAAIALVAMYVPARRATKVDPWVALRYE